MTTAVVRRGVTGHVAVRRVARLAITLAVTFAVVLGVALLVGLALAPFVHPVGSTTVDPVITDRLLAARSQQGLDVVGRITLLGGPTIVLPVAATATVLLTWAQRYRLAVCVATTVVGAAAINSLARVISTPRRPPGELGLVHPFFSSFPSGHAAEAAACFLGLAIVVAALTSRRTVRAVAWSAAVIVMLAVGSRACTSSSTGRPTCSWASSSGRCGCSARRARSTFARGRVRPVDVRCAGGAGMHGTSAVARHDGPMRPPLAELLDLEAHPEGGWFRRTWTSPTPAALPDGRVRAAASAILFHLPAGDASAWHRVRADDLWIAQVGRVTLELGGDGPAPIAVVTVWVLGVDVAAGDAPQVLVPAGTWQRTVPGETDALVTCVVSPEFHFDDFELHPDAAS